MVGGVDHPLGWIKHLHMCACTRSLLVFKHNCFSFPGSAKKWSPYLQIGVIRTNKLKVGVLVPLKLILFGTCEYILNSWMIAGTRYLTIWVLLCNQVRWMWLLFPHYFQTWLLIQLANSWGEDWFDIRRKGSGWAGEWIEGELRWGISDNIWGTLFDLLKMIVKRQN